MTYLLLDTSTPVCRVTIVLADGSYHSHEWQADRILAHGLLKYLSDIVEQYGAKLSTLDGIGVLQGPGSFTGLRIGLTVLNTIADSCQTPIVGATGDDWQQEVVTKLKQGEDDHIVMPLYGHDARITTPRK